MPRYFFNVHNVLEGYDAVGEDLRDDDAGAWREATIIAGELFKDIDGSFQPGQEWRLEVTDEQRKPIYVIRVTAEKK
jgi:hypothetical protein